MNDNFEYIGESNFQCNQIANTVKIWQHKKTTITFVHIEAGSFTMGSENEEFCQPLREVTVKDFLISQYPITQKTWLAIMGKNPSYHKNEDAPIHLISWDDAQEFCSKTGLSLPSEAQWEFAARTRGKTSKYYWGNPEDFQDYLWCMENIALTKAPPAVGQKKPSALGIYDILGNVWEWCADSWQEDYENAPSDCKPRIFESEKRPIRGGHATSHYAQCCSFIRAGKRRNGKDLNIGFRVVFNL